MDLTSGQLFAIGLRYYFLWLIGLLFSSAVVYYPVRAVIRSRRREQQVSPNCVCEAKVIEMCRCGASRMSTRSSLRLLSLPSIVRRKHLKLAQQSQSDEDIEQQMGEEAGVTDWARGLLKQIRSIERRNRTPTEPTLRQSRLALPTPTPVFQLVVHSASTANVENVLDFAYPRPGSPQDVTLPLIEHSADLTLPSLDYGREVDITDIVECYSDSESSFGSLTTLETPRIPQHVAPTIVVQQGQDHEGPLESEPTIDSSPIDDTRTTPKRATPARRIQSPKSPVPRARLAKALKANKECIGVRLAVMSSKPTAITDSKRNPFLIEDADMMGSDAIGMAM